MRVIKTRYGWAVEHDRGHLSAAPNEATARQFAAATELADTGKAALDFIEMHKASLIGNECTAEDYEKAMKPLAAALRKAGFEL